MPESVDRLHSPVTTCIRKDVATLRAEQTIHQALEEIRKSGLGDSIGYFYVVDDKDRLVGVVPTRRLLTSPLHQPLSEVMVTRIISIPERATVLEAYEFFVLYKHLAYPVVNDKRHILGVVDIGMFTDNAFDLADQSSMDRLFEMIGFRIQQVREASPFRAFRFRFPWLLATIGSGTICALLAGSFEATLAQSLVLAFFLTLVLGLGESVSMQSMAVQIQSLQTRKPTLLLYLRGLRKEAATALILGSACGSVVGLIAWLWRGDLMAALSIGGSLILTIWTAGVLGLSIPTLLHRMNLDLKIAAGPITLAMADISTLLIYLSLATLLL